jgi:hypothetical protein
VTLAVARSRLGKAFTAGALIGVVGSVLAMLMPPIALEQGGTTPLIDQPGGVWLVGGLPGSLVDVAACD